MNNRIGLLIAFVTGCTMFAGAQVTTLQGVVVSSGGYLLYGVEIVGLNGKLVEFTGTMGDFNFEMPCTDSCLLTFSQVGFVTKEVWVVPNRFVTVVMETAEQETGPHYIPENDREQASDRRLGFHWIFGADVYSLDFQEFEPDIGQANVDQLNKQSGMLLFKLGFDIRNIYFSFDYGFGSGDQRSEEDQDSIFYESKENQYGVHVGYHVIRSKRFFLTPEFGLKWYRSRMINSPGEYEIDLDDYFPQRALDIRFVQLTWFAGINFHYRMGPADSYGESTWTIGAYVGYLGKINTHPWTKSISNKLLTDKRLEVGAVNWGITAGFYIR